MGGIGQARCFFSKFVHCDLVGLMASVSPGCREYLMGRGKGIGARIFDICRVRVCYIREVLVVLLNCLCPPVKKELYSQ